MTETTPVYKFSQPTTTLDVEAFRAYLQAERQSHLEAVDRIERILGIAPTTAEIRKQVRQRGVHSA